MYEPKCATCGKVITWAFWICADCAEKWEVSKVPFSKWPKWLNYLARMEKKERDRHNDNNRIKDGKELYVSEVWNDSHEDEVFSGEYANGFSYTIDHETLMEYRIHYAGYLIKTSDGIFELQDSDWENTYSYTLG